MITPFGDNDCYFEGSVNVSGSITLSLSLLCPFSIMLSGRLLRDILTFFYITLSFVLVAEGTCDVTVDCHFVLGKIYNR
jgi:hypothetical protein